LSANSQNPGEIAIALRHMANAFGGLPTIARRAGINVTQAYRSLSRKGNPSFRTVNAAGFELVARKRRSIGGKAA
jgi:DNA-binding phage protein